MVETTESATLQISALPCAAYTRHAWLARLTRARRARFARRTARVLLADFWYFSSQKSTIKEKYLYVSIRRQQALPCLGDADRVCFVNRSIPALQDKNPSALIAKKKKHLPYPLFLLQKQAQKKKLSKRKAPKEDFALCGARPSPPTARAAF